MAVEHKGSPLQLAVGEADHDVSSLQWTRLSDASGEREFCAAWLALQCAMLPGAVRAVVVLGPPDVGPYTPVAFWPESLSVATPALAEAAERALSERNGVVLRRSDAAGAAPGNDAVGWPLQLEGHLFGLVAVELARGRENQLQGVMRGLQWGAGGLESLLARRELKREEATRERLIGVLDLAAAMLEQPAFEEAARALVNEMATRFDCDRVIFGLHSDGRSRVEALSHAAEFAARMSLMNAVAAAMDEACDQHESIVYPSNDRAQPLVARAHAELTRLHGAGAVLTVPFSTRSGFAGAVTLERPGGRMFDTADVELVESLMAVVAPMLEARRDADRGVARHARDSLVAGARDLLGPRHVAWKVALLAIVAVAVFFSVATGEFRVTAPASLEGEVRRVIVAPFDGYIATAPVRAGQVVKKEAILATLDARDLMLERQKWSSQAAQYQRQYEEAAAARDRAKALVAQAQDAQATAQLQLVQEQLARAVLSAPFDGIVVSGDLSQQLGSAVRRGQTLFEVAPLSNYRLVVQVDEGDISYVRPGQKGYVVLSAVTEQSLAFTVDSVTPVTTAKEGRNAFRVEALLEGASARLRPGMEGIAKISVDERRFIWIWTYRLVDWLRLTFWTWWP